MKLGKTTALHFLSQAVISATGFAATFVIAFLLGAPGLGTYSIAVALGVFWFGIPAAAVSTAIRKRLSEGASKSSFFSAGLLINGVLAVGLAGCVLLGSALVSRYVGDPQREFLVVVGEYELMVAVLIVGGIVFETARAGLEGQKRVATSGGLQALERVGRTGLQVALLVAGFGIAEITLGHAASLLVVGLLGMWMTDLRPTLPSWRVVRNILGYARYAWMSALRVRVFGWMDTLVLSFFVTANLIGVYEAAWGIASMLGMVSLSIRRTLFPEVSEVAESGNDDYIHHILEEGLLFSGVFVIPGLAGAAVIGRRVLEFYGPEFGVGHLVLVLLTLSYAGDVYASQFLNVVNAIDRPDIAYRVNTAFIVTNLALNVVLVWQYGWVGAAVATVVSSVLRLGLSGYSFTKTLGTPQVPFREIGLEGVAAVGMAVVVWLAKPVAPEGRLGTVLLVALGATVYVALLLAMSTRIRAKASSLAGTTL